MTINKMDIDIKKIKILFLVVFSMILTLVLLPLPAQAANNKKITFQTTSELSVVPDQMLVNFSLRGQALTLKEATNILAVKTKLLQTLLNDKNISPKLLQSYNLSSYPEYNPNPKDPNTSVITGYNITQSYNLKLNDLNSAGSLITYLTDNLGDNLSINSSTLSIASLSNYEKKLLSLATNKAQARAKLYSQAFKGKNIKLLSLTEANINTYTPYPRMSAASDSSAPTITIDPGTQNISLTITTVWIFN